MPDTREMLENRPTKRTKAYRTKTAIINRHKPYDRSVLATQQVRDRHIKGCMRNWNMDDMKDLLPKALRPTRSGVSLTSPDLSTSILEALEHLSDQIRDEHVVAIKALQRAVARRRDSVVGRDPLFVQDVERAIDLVQRSKLQAPSTTAETPDERAASQAESTSLFLPSTADTPDATNSTKGRHVQMSEELAALGTFTQVLCKLAAEQEEIKKPRAAHGERMKKREDDFRAEIKKVEEALEQEIKQTEGALQEEVKQLEGAVEEARSKAKKNGGLHL